MCFNKSHNNYCQIRNIHKLSSGLNSHHHHYRRQSQNLNPPLQDSIQKTNTQMGLRLWSLLKWKEDSTHSSYETLDTNSLNEQ
ncbi:unnamed protein product [Rotaria sp. Silwood2]|nr:unnamed protein product [Rotaria sp. Silwood2]CAF2502262.1 unnamed protein product [Rotaria sp. Silwood2]CAF2899939.1 unnamed protein product [Rotaria sp. Silwood2]CAF3235373.1 unnamed protein product [Rotaria sp. Silwood2]CAF4337363.1 unnamed protein product [Rotaria sp. Silwood2]